MTLTRLLSATVLGLCLLSGCGGGTVNFTGNDRAIGADGEARWEEIAGGAILVELEMKHLPPPARISGGLTTYVVWFAPTGSQPTRSGTLEYDEGDRTGRMSATNATKQFQVIVSAERNLQAVSPGDYVVARFNVDAR
jgi:hypothetical protein